MPLVLISRLPLDGPHPLFWFGSAAGRLRENLQVFQQVLHLSRAQERPAEFVMASAFRQNIAVDNPAFHNIICFKNRQGVSWQHQLRLSN